MGWYWITLACIAAAAYLAYVIWGAVIAMKQPVTVDKATRAKLNAVEFKAKSDKPCGDWAYIAESGQESFARRIELVRAAQLTLDITLYTIKPGITGEAFFAEVLAAADRGVRVRLLLSGKTNKLRRHKDVFRALRGHNCVMMQEFNPLRPFQPLGWNVMMHDKIIIADGKALSLGGRNLGDEYCNPPGYCGSLTHDREVFILGAKPGSAVRDVLEYFEDLWEHPTNRAVKMVADKGEEHKTAVAALALQFATEHPEFYQTALPLGSMVLSTRRVTLVHNPLTAGKKQPWVGWQMFRLARMGTQVRIQTPYMTDNPFIVDHLAILAETIEIDILTNSCKSSPNLPAFSVYLANRKKFLKAGVTLREYAAGDGSSIHGKSMLVGDHLCAIGSFNLDDRSMFIDTETMLVIDSPQLATALRSHMDQLAAQSAEVQPDNTYKESDSDKLASPGKQRLFRIGATIFKPLRFLV